MLQNKNFEMRLCILNSGVDTAPAAPAAAGGARVRQAQPSGVNLGKGGACRPLLLAGGGAHASCCATDLDSHSIRRIHLEVVAIPDWEKPGPILLYV
jgi:hypothetical protein